MLWTLIPAKPFAEAKQRLAGLLGPSERSALAEALLARTVRAVRRAQGDQPVWVVAPDDSVTATALAAGATGVFAARAAGLNAQLAEAAAEAPAAAGVLVLHADLPLLRAQDIVALVGRPGPVVIAPDRHGSGTNALLLAPPDVIHPSFGPGSRARHEQAAQTAQARWRVAHPRSLTLDVDTADDLAALRAALDARAGGAAHTRGLLTRMDRR